MGKIEARYNVNKINDPAGKHGDCWYWVLDIRHDSFARTALRAYADAIEPVDKELATQLRVRVNDVEMGLNHDGSKFHQS